MPGRLPMLTLLGAVCACDAPPRDIEAKALPPVVQVKQAAAPSMPRLYELSEQCGKSSRDVFQRDWKDSIAKASDGHATVDITNHYNAKREICFTLLTVNHGTDGLRKLLFDVNEREPYGEYLGPLAGHPKTCRVEDLHCASSGEWDILVSPYMED